MRMLFRKRYALKQQTAENKKRTAEAKAKVAAKKAPNAIQKIVQAAEARESSLTEALSEDELKRLGYRAPRSK